MERFSTDSYSEREAAVKGISEVVQALVLCGRPLSHIPANSEHSIKVYISSAQDAFQNCHQPFKIKILSDRGLDVSQALAECWFSNLVKATTGDLCDGTLFVTRQVGEEEWIQEQYNLTTTTCSLHNCDHIRGKKMPPFKIQFQVLDFQENIVKSYQKLQCLFRIITLFQPNLHLTLRLRICGLDCKNDFGSDLEFLLEDMTRPPIVISPNYYTRAVDIECSPVHVKTGEIIPLPKPAECDSLHPLTIKAVAILVPFTNPSCTENHGFINILFGMDSQPFSVVKMNDGVLMCDSYQSCQCDTCINPDPFECPIQIHMKHLSSSADRLKDQKSFVIYIYLSVQSQLPSAQPYKSTAQLGLFQMIQTRLPHWYPIWKERIQLAINSALCSIWFKDYVCIPREVHQSQQIAEPDTDGEVMTAHTDPVPLATGSLLSFLSATTNDDFKRSCLQALKVRTMGAAKQVLTTELSRVALHHPYEHSSTQEDEDCYSQTLDEAFEDLDKWTEE